MKEINLPDVLEVINRWGNKVAGCGNGRTILERIVQELTEKYGN